MTDFATDLLWEEEKQVDLPVPAPLHDRRRETKPRGGAPVPQPPTAESQAERLQRVVGNAALVQEAEATARTTNPPAATPVPAKTVRPGPNDAGAKAKVSSPAPSQIAGLAVLLDQVLASFARNARQAELLTLALRLEHAPPGIAAAFAGALARAVMRADPGQRAEIGAHIKAQLGDRRDLLLAQLLADRLSWFWMALSHASPAAAPPPPPTC